MFYYHFCFYQNKILPLNKVRFPLNDLGLLRGMAIFDYFLVLNETPIFIKDHLFRFFISAKKVFKDDFKFSKKEIEEIIKKLIKKNKLKNGAIRIVLTGGKTLDGKTYLNSPSLLILVEKFKFLPKSFYQKGIKLLTFNFKRPFSEIKTTFYFPLILLQETLLKEKAFEPLYVKKGKVLETATSNFFIFKNNTLITPKKEILSGITREKVLKFAKKYFKIEQRDIKLSETFKANEAFITATGKGVIPVVKIDDKIIGTGKPGKNTKILMEFYFDLLKKESKTF